MLVVELHEAELAEIVAVDLDIARFADLDADGVVRQQDMLAGEVEHGVALLGHQRAVAADAEAAGARVADAQRRLDGEIAVALDGDVQRVAGHLDGARLGVAVSADAVSEGDLGLVALVVVLRHEGVEQDMLGVITRGAGIGQVVGRDVHILEQRQLAGESYINAVIHNLYAPIAMNDAGLEA